MIKVEIEESNNTAILNIYGEITMATAKEIDIACEKYINSGLKVLAFDLQNVTFIDSFGISRIIKHSKAFACNGTEFVLINLNDNINQVFKIATFDRLFRILTKYEFSEKYLYN